MPTCASKDRGELMIGLNADEAEDRTGNHELEAEVNYLYPLVEDGYDRQRCKDILEDYGLLPQFPPYMDRGGCKFCFYKSKKEYAAMVHFAPEEIEEIARMEESIQDKRSKFFRIKSNMPRLRDFIALEKNNLIGETYGATTWPTKIAKAVACSAIGSRPTPAKSH